MGVLRAGSKVFLEHFRVNFEGPWDLLGPCWVSLASLRSSAGPTYKIMKFPGKRVPHFGTCFGHLFQVLGVARTFLGYVFFIGFSLDFCKGRISRNSLQIALTPRNMLPLAIFSVLTPV